MKHGNSCPRACSQCLGVNPRRVVLTSAGALVDGQLAPPPKNDRVAYGRRGGKR